MATTKKATENVQGTKVQSVESIMKEGLREGNRESKSISGALKIIGMFWGVGYQKAFNVLGISSKKSLTPKVIFDMVHESLKEEGAEDVVCKTWEKVYEKNAKGEIVKVDKHAMFHYELKEVKTWTPNKVARIIAQSIDGGAMPVLPDYIVKANEKAAKKAAKNGAKKGEETSEKKAA